MASRSTRGARGGDGTVDFDVQSNLRDVLAAVKEFDPKLATEVRKKFRAIGESAIKDMSAILDEPPPGMVTGFTYAKQFDSRGRLRRMKTGMSTKGANRRRSTGQREVVKQGLKTRVTTGKSRTSIRVMATNGTLRKVYNTRSWRHPVFGDTENYVEQAGTSYFNRGAYAQKQATEHALRQAIEAALEAVDRASKSVTTSID